MTKTVLITLAMAILLSVNAQESASTVLQKTVDLLSAKMLYHYEAAYRIKYFDNADTISEGKFQCMVQRVPKDTVLKYYVRLYNDKEERIYDGKSYVGIGHPEKRMIIDSPTVNGKSFTNTNIRKSFVPWLVYSPKSLTKLLEDTAKTALTTVMEGNQKCYKIDCWLTTNKQLTYYKMSIYINQATYLPVKMESFVKYMDVQSQYDELILNDFRLDEIPAAGFASLYALPSGYQTEFYKPNIMVTPELLPVGSAAPSFTGKYANGKAYRFDSAHNNQLLLFDFWYTACAPCLAAMPTLQKYYQQYKGKGLTIIGINPIDQPASNAKERDALLKKQGVTYPLIYTNKDIVAAWAIYVFPSLYLVKNGKIVYAHMGNREEDMQQLEAAIKQYTNK